MELCFVCQYTFLCATACAAKGRTSKYQDGIIQLGGIGTLFRNLGKDDLKI